MDNNSQVIDIHRIFQLLPHRYPMLLIDRVVDYKIGEYLIGLKNVSINEPYFPGHFPIRPVMPGVLILEALAQATGILAFITSEKTPQDTSLYYLVGIDEARFKQPVEPGDQLLLRVEVIKSKQGIWKFTGIASVDGKTVASAGLMCAERDV